MAICATVILKYSERTEDMKPISLATKLLTGYIKTSGKIGSVFKSAPQIASADFDYMKPSDNTTFTVGFGKAPMMPEDITKKKYYVAGYDINKPATGILDPLYAHAIWLDDNSGRGGVVFVSLDAVGLLKTDADIIKESLGDFLAESGCRSINIISTHSHASIDTMGIWGPLPRTGRSADYMTTVKEAVITAVKAAYADRRTGKLYLGRVEVPDMQKDIRTPVVFSKILTRLRFVPDDKSREIHFINFASHPETLTSENSLISADFPAYLRERIKEKTGADTIYFSGAIGGMITMSSGGKTMPEKIEGTKNLGRRLGDYALSITDEVELKANINLIKQEFFVEAENIVLMTAAQLSILHTNRYHSKEASLGYLLRTEVSYFEIGELKMLLLPGETFPEVVYGGYLSKEESATGLGPEANPDPLIEIVGDPNLLVFNLANDEIGYILPPNDFLLSEDAPYLERAKDRHGRNHYEETNSVGPKTAVKIAEVVREIMETVNRTKADNS